MNFLKYKNFEFDTFIKGFDYLFHMFSFWLEYLSDTTNDEYMRKEFWYHLSGQYFSWYEDPFSSLEYCDMFHHLYH